MKKRKWAMTRRDFIRAGSCVAAGGLMGLPLIGRARGEVKSRVVLVRDEAALDGRGMPVPEVLDGMLDRALTALLEAPDTSSAWRALAGPEDVVGIKSNVWHYLRTPEALEETVRSRLMEEAGVRRENIAVDDRGVLSNPVFRRSTALINMRPMRTHHWSGLGTLLKNYIMFTPSPPEYHPNACENLGALWHLPALKGKTRLNILVMLTPLFHGTGPHHFNRKYIWPYCGLILSTDPVAADATGAGIIQAKRNDFFGRDAPISPPVRHIHAADTRFGLGNSRPDRIHLVTLGWKRDLLL